MKILIVISLLCFHLSSFAKTSDKENNSHMDQLDERTLTAIQISQHSGDTKETKLHVKALMNFTRNNHPRDLHEIMPPAFKALSKGMNKDWKKLAKDELSSDEIDQSVINIMKTCNTCHQAYRIE